MNPLQVSFTKVTVIYDANTVKTAQRYAVQSRLPDPPLQICMLVL
jgi:hypothetical protein